MRHTENQSQSTPQPMRILPGLARRVAAVISECNYASRRMLDLHMTPGRYASDHGRASGTDGGSLVCASGSPDHEPSARDRVAC
jgi:hypothetical protein